MKNKIQLLLVFVLFYSALQAKIHPVLNDQVVIQDDSLLVAFDQHTGALVKMERKATGWNIQRRPELGASFRLLVPLSGRRSNYVQGQAKSVQVEKLSDKQVRITWQRLVSEHGGVLPMKFTALVTLQNGALTFSATLENNSAFTVETVDYPYFGDLNAPAPGARMQARTMWYGNLESDDLLPSFRNSKGYWGVFTPTKTFDSNRSLFCLIQSPGQGLYVEMKDPTQRYLLQYTFVQHPGVVQSTDSYVPAGDEIDGHKVHLNFSTCHFLFTHPHSTVKLVPVVLRCYTGDWHAGVDLYKEWRKTWFKEPHMPQWVKQVNSWQQLQINSPEQDFRVHYKDLVQYGRECAQNGVAAIQLVGWNYEGQDGGDPSQNTDPGLGTTQELKDAIAKIQAMGVKIILFGKLNWADKTTEWYKKELYKYAATDPYGIPYEQQGYDYYTPTQLAGINTHRRAVMDFQSPGYRNVITKEYQKLLALGGSGWLFDENCHHAAVKYSFATNHGYKAPGYIYGGDMPLASQLRASADKVSPDFLFAGEGQQDWLMQYYSCSYFRINNGSVPVCRYIDPQAPLMVAVTGFDDREMLNMILLDRYIISYEPFNFKGHLGDFELTLAYGKKIDALRKRYQDYLWNADFKDTMGAQVTGDGALRYSVFVTPAGKRTVVVINQDLHKAINAKVTLPHSGELFAASPESPEAVATSGSLQIAARSAVVIMEH